MDLRHRRLHHVDVLSVRGHLRAPEAIKLRERINQLFDEGRSCLVLDLEHLESIGSSGLYVLIEAHTCPEGDELEPGRHPHHPCRSAHQEGF